MEKKTYLSNTPLDEAMRKWTEKLTKSGLSGPSGAEAVRVTDSIGRITAEAVFAKLSSPFFHSSAMDGYAVKFTDTLGASERTPKTLAIPEQALYVATGDPLPEGFDAVIMVEDVNIIRDQKQCYEDQSVRAYSSPSGKRRTGGLSEFIEIIKPATPWQHIRAIGEDIVTTELILPENHRIRPVDTAAMLAGGLTEIPVRRRPRVVIIPTGSEMVEPGASVKKGDIIESNSMILSGLVSEWGGEAVRFAIVPDNIPALKKAVLEAAGTGDLVVINAGASAGHRDFTAAVVEQLGEIVVHGIAIRPGKPAILGWVSGKPVLGVPGYPVSAYITFELFAKPLMHMWQGIEMKKPLFLKAKLSRQLSSALGMEEFIRVKVGKVGDSIIASPVSRGAGILMSLVRADGLLRIPAMSEGIGAGTEVEVRLLKEKQDIENTVVCIGSHDNTLDLLANFFSRKNPGFSLSSAHVGSMGGLVALKRGEAHIAGTHLLDEESGDYNVSFIRRLLPEKKIVLINLVYRQQGLMVLRGNPKTIRGFEDLSRTDITFINRQGGSGTRLLTDMHLKKAGIDPMNVKGYQKEEFTHMGVASAVLSGIADTGLGILAAARALGLDFIPVARERYDIAVPEEHYSLEMVQRLFDIIRNDQEFRNAVAVLGGYDISDMGKVMFRHDPSSLIHHG